MLDASKLQLLSRLKILGKKIFDSHASGDYQSFLRGIGYDFLQLRSYHDGDDIRFLDWRSFAKTGKLQVKEMIPERDRAVIILLDCSASQIYSSTQQLKSELALDLVSSLAWLALRNKDKIGLLTFGEKAEKWLPCNKDKKQFFSIFNTATEEMGKYQNTSIKSGLEFLMKLAPKKSLIFVISDFIDQNLQETNPLWKILSKKHVIIPVSINDKLEKKINLSGYLVECKDPESNDSFWLDTNDTTNIFLNDRDKDVTLFFQKIGLRRLNITTEDDLLRELMFFFEYKR